MESQLKIAEYLKRIQADSPKPIHSYKVIDRGWTNLVIEINCRWILRFVRDLNNQQIAIEREFLPKFAKISPIKIPEIIIGDRYYIAYRKNSGIIDFGDFCLGDPAADFAGFYRNFGRQFTQELISYYQRPMGKNFWTRIEYEAKRKMFCVVYFAKNYGFESDVPNIIK